MTTDDDLSTYRRIQTRDRLVKTALFGTYGVPFILLAAHIFAPHASLVQAITPPLFLVGQLSTLCLLAYLFVHFVRNQRLTAGDRVYWFIGSALLGPLTVPYYVIDQVFADTGFEDDVDSVLA